MAAPGRALDWAPAIILSIAFGVAVGAAYAHADGGFDAPDDSSNYATAQALVDDGRPWLDIPAGLTDEHDLLHQRGFTTTEDRAVPIQPVITAAMHAAIWAPTGSFAVSAGLFAALALFGWIFAAARIGNMSALWASSVPAIAMPLIFWMTRQYFTASTYLLFLPWSVGLAVVAWERRSWRLAILAGALHGLALAARPDFLFAHALAVPLVASCAWAAGARMPSRGQLAGFAGGFFGAAGPLVLGVNTWLLGSPFSFGYDSANINPTFAASPGEIGVPVVDSALRRLFPTGIASAADLVELSSRYLVQMMPLFFILVCAAVGLFCWRRRPLVIAAVLGSFAVFALYVIVSHTGPNSSGSSAASPSPAHSLVRYYLPLVTVMALFLAAGIARLLQLVKGDLSRVTIAAVLLAPAAYGAFAGLFSYGNATLFSWAGANRDERVGFEEVLRVTEPGAFVVTPWYDRYVALGGRQPLAWYPSERDTTYRPPGLSDTIQRVQATGAPVYFIDFGELKPPFTAELCDRNLAFTPVTGRRNVYRVVASPACRRTMHLEVAPVSTWVRL